MMVLYRSHEQTDLHTYCWSFSQVQWSKIFVLILKPCAPSSHVFLMHHDDLNWILKEGHQRNISAKLYWNWSSGFGQKDFLSVL